jgi:hypothetical protein
VLTPLHRLRVAGMAWLGNAYAMRKRFARNGGPFSFALVDLAIFASTFRRRRDRPRQRRHADARARRPRNSASRLL